MSRLVIATIVAIGCGGSHPPAAPSAPAEHTMAGQASPKSDASPAASESPGPAKGDAPAKPETAAKQEPAPPAPFAWPEIPALDKVATEPLHGVAAGQPLDIEKVVVMHTSDGWEVRLVPGSRPGRDGASVFP